MFRLDNELRPYAWGSRTAISELLHRPASGGPEAELWLGAHPDSPSRLPDGQGLDSLIAQDPMGFLGEDSVSRFGPRLPFLLKVLAAAEPLSLQVHPSLEQAREGFAREEAAGVPRDAATRNYRDDNHKPEMILALSPFRALCGFRAVKDSSALFAVLASGLAEGPGRDAAQDFATRLAGEPGGLQDVFRTLIAGSEGQRQASEGLSAVVEGLPDGDPGRVPLEAAAALQRKYPGDPGVLISLLLNLVDLRPGEAIHLPAGNVHAYLEGLGVEVMASSDNVLRGGLTPKHIDVAELLATVEFESLPVPYLKAGENALGEKVFAPPFQEFSLQELTLAAADEDFPSASLHQSGAAIILVVDGDIRLDGPRGELTLGRGESAFLPASDSPVTVHLHGAGHARAFVATTGLIQQTDSATPAEA
ncbi:mannose-6-phosphate isomerase, class I [Arthrobacter sp. NPDC090010]|uniref:mannose-6-phosphate isomerase, class I n=1 Tax=Arthrobacter sp. NPDC090010 TaxID=3363942 RepID=UPI0038151520